LLNIEVHTYLGPSSIWLVNIGIGEIEFLLIVANF